MRALIDASVIVAILHREPDGERHRQRLEAFDGETYVSPIVIYEATIGLARAKVGTGLPLSPVMILEASKAVNDLLADMGSQEIAIDRSIADRALDATMRFGRIVRHPAALNMGDCFAYACASSRAAAMFYKGDDFSKTDISAA